MVLRDDDVPEVPNAPCGVESSKSMADYPLWLFVPNAPCGVERFEPWAPSHPQRGS